MPFTLLAHQAPLLPIRKIDRKYYSPFWLIIGTIIPDFELPLRHSIHNIGPYEFYWGHSIFGQLFWTVPISLVLGISFLFFLKIFLSDIERNYYLQTIKNDLGINNTLTKKSLEIALVSSCIGGITHALLDSFTHNTSLIFYPLVSINFNFPVYFTIYFIDSAYPITILEVIWYAFSIILGLVSSIFVIKYILNLHKQFKQAT